MKEVVLTENERLKAFLYLLLRDAVNFGAMEKALQEVNYIDNGRKGINYTEKTQAAYAERMARSVLGAASGRAHG